MPGVDAIHTSGPLVVAGTSGFSIDTCDPVQVDPKLAEVIVNAAGLPYAGYVGAMSVSPLVSLTTTDIATVLGVFGLNGLSFPQSTTYTTVTQWFSKLGTSTARTSGSTHFKTVLNQGLIVPKQITWTQGQAAKLTLDVIATYDGTNAPFIYTDGASIPAASVDELFTGGKVSINGSELMGIQGGTIDFGIKTETVFAGGHYYPYYVGILECNPRITLKTKQTPSLSTFGLTGTAQGATDSLIYLTKISKNGTRVADGTAEHIKISIDDGMVWTGGFGGGNNASNEGDLIIQPAYDGTNAIIAISIAAIT